jgi:hypothetical protein
MSTTELTEIEINYPIADELHLRLALGACRLKIVPGESEAWITGIYRDPAGALPLEIVLDGGIVKLTQQHHWFEMLNVLGAWPSCELSLGQGRPYKLTLEGGANECSLDLGGLPITELVVKQGAGKYDIDFTQPNPQAMGLFALSAGAAGVTLKHLANANLSELTIEGGAAGFNLDFGGTLQHDATVKINTGMSAVEIQIPATTAAKIIAKADIGSLDVGDGFAKKEGAFWSLAALEGQPPLLTIEANVAVGSLHFVTS